MKMEVQWLRRLVVALSAGSWIVLASIEHTAMYWLGSLLAVIVMGVHGSNRSAKAFLIALCAFGWLLFTCTQSGFLMAGALLLASFSSRLSHIAAHVAQTFALTAIGMLLYEIGLISPEVNALSWKVTHWLTQMTGEPGVLGAAQSRLLLVLPPILYGLMYVGLFSIRGAALLMLLIISAVTALLTQLGFWYGWMLLLAVLMGSVSSRSCSPSKLRIGLTSVIVAGVVVVNGVWLRGAWQQVSPIRVRILEGGLKTLSLPPPEPIRAPQDAQFGNLLQVLRLYGFEVYPVAEPMLEQVLPQTEVLVVINPTQELSARMQNAVERWVRSGGALLVLGDHTDIAGIMVPLNRLIHFTEIRFRFDSAIPQDRFWRWKNCLRGEWHPMFYGRTNADFGISIGASLEIGWRAQPLVTGEHAFSDWGRAWYGLSRLGDMTYNAGQERLGGLVLVAEQRCGKGVVQVWGDTSGFQDNSLTTNHHYVAQLVAILAQRRTPTEARLLIATVTLLAATTIVVLLWGHPFTGVIALMVLVASVQGTGWLVQRFASSAVRIQQSDFALLDQSHGVLYPQEPHEKGLNTFCETALRAGMPLLSFNDFAFGIQLKPRWWIIHAPLVPYTPQEAARLEQYVRAGGNLMVVAGYPQGQNIKHLLQAFGMEVSSTPVGAAHNARIGIASVRLQVLHNHMAAVSEQEPTKTPAYDADVSFKESYALRGDPQTKSLVRCWGHVIAQYKRLGAGMVVLIGDNRFILDENLGQREERNEPTIRLLLAIMAEQLP